MSDSPSPPKRNHASRKARPAPIQEDLYAGVSDSDDADGYDDPDSVKTRTGGTVR